jgi:C4-type Zn-finger protein
MTMGAFEIKWIDRRREPQCAADPTYPDGRDVDCRVNDSPSCVIELPYPAERCGIYVAECRLCGYRIGVTTAGRADDPRKVTLTCRHMERA